MLVLKVLGKVGEAAAVAVVDGQEYPCVIGKNGVIAATDKREGDGKTPLGRWMLTDGYYRADRRKPAGVCKQKLNIGMGWCDAPEDKLYNKLCDVTLPASHEKLWREGAEYDYIGVMSYNLNGKRGPDGRGMGSAIFLHVWKDDATDTQGCVALKDIDLASILNAGVDVVEVVLAA